MADPSNSIILDYQRPAVPPPGPGWLRLSGKEDLSIALISLYVFENTGIRLLAAILRGAGIRVHEIYFKDWVTNRIEAPSEDELDLLVEQVRLSGVDLVGMSVRASAFHRIARTVTERIRRATGLPVLWGGMHASSCPEDSLRVADLIAVGEAERSVPELITRLKAGEPADDVAGIACHTADGIRQNPDAPLVTDLDALPFPDFVSPDKVSIRDGKVLPGDPYVNESVYLVMASRGCPFPSCSFCSNSVMDKRYEGQPYFRVRSVGDVLAEVALARATFPNLKRIRFDDEEFPVQASWFDEFCDRWADEAGLTFEIHMDPRVVTASRLARLKAVGLDMIFSGIQSTEAINRDLYCRNVSDEQVLASARTIHASGVRAGYQVILDDPVSTARDKERLFELLMKIPRPYEMILFSLTIYPGSRLADILEERGLLSPEAVEGPATKVFRQFRVDLSFSRTPEDRFWTALIVMVSKNFVPKSLLRELSKSQTLRRHPEALTALAFGTNVVKLGIMGLDLVARGEISAATVRRWLHFKSLVTY